MKRQFVLKLIFVLFLMPNLMIAQRITRVIPEYVLIDTNIGLGKIDQQLKVYRISGNQSAYIGRVKIVKFANGKTAAKKIYISPGEEIKVGDIVRPFQMGEEADPYDTMMRNYALPASDTPTTLEIKDRFGLRLGYLVPTTGMEYIYKNSFDVGAMIKLAGFMRHRFFIDAMLPLLKMETVGGLEMKSTLFAVQLVDRIRIGDKINYDFGGGWYHATMSVNLNGNAESLSSSGYGFFVGFSLDIPTHTVFTITPSLRYHSYPFNSEQKEFVTLSLHFYINNFISIK